MDKAITDGFRDYCSRMRNACMRHCASGGIFADAEDCVKLARQIGYAIPDFTEDELEIRQLISGTYSDLCVRLYNLNPPIDAKRWNNAVFEGAKRCLDYRTVQRARESGIQEILERCRNDHYYMAYLVNPYRGNRYAIYERRDCSALPDAMLFCTHDREAAIMEWNRIKDLPKKERVSCDLIF